MKKISYPDDKVAMHAEYGKLFGEERVNAIDAHLNHIDFNGDPLSFKTLITLSLRELIGLKNDLETYSNRYKVNSGKKNKRGGIIYTNDFDELFNYKSLQPKLAKFFMNSGKIELKVCHYCAIDFINAFIDFPDYKDGLTFVNHADKYDLMFMEGIDEAMAGAIIKGRSYADYDSVPVSPETLEIIKAIPSANSHNHFTLDHLLPQGEYPYFSLCLYNLVPSCYSCNSKFKNDVEFDIDDDLIQVSPTSDNYRFNDCFSFKVFYSKQFGDLKGKDDFELRKEINGQEKHVQKYLKMFKIMGRYAAHKQQILDLIDKMQNYPESRVHELFLQTGLPKSEIRKMIFGKDLYEEEFDGQAFVKFRRDIAKNINLKDVRTK